jgi:hypothetical protein
MPLNIPSIERRHGMNFASPKFEYLANLVFGVSGYPSKRKARRNEFG